MNKNEIINIIKKFDGSKYDANEFASENNLKLIAHGDTNIYIIDKEGKMWIYKADIETLREVEKEEFEKYLKEEWNDDIVNAMIKGV